MCGEAGAEAFGLPEVPDLLPHAAGRVGLVLGIGVFGQSTPPVPAIQSPSSASSTTFLNRPEPYSHFAGVPYRPNGCGA